MKWRGKKERAMKKKCEEQKNVGGEGGGHGEGEEVERLVNG